MMFVVMAEIHRIHDLCARMVDRKSELGYVKLHVPMGILGLLQHVVGVVSIVGPL